ncbi:hypothetical protein [Methanogenium cariaci]|uniref:hypothetical protein n=1 Tax=Methanogenium cariaci TaxID=2197 RepID=UPI000783F1F7|nr:hypothetical protein [Methanogenium cariaci]
MIPKKIPILFVVAVLFLSGVSGPVSGYTMSESTYQLVSDCYTDVIAGYGNVPIYGRDGTVISTGVIADIPDEKGMWDWRYETKQIVNDTRSDMKAYYFPPQGPIILYGSDLLGTICVASGKRQIPSKKPGMTSMPSLTQKPKTEVLKTSPSSSWQHPYLTADRSPPGLIPTRHR